MFHIAVVVAADMQEQPSFQQIHHFLTDIIAVIETAFECFHFINEIFMHAVMGIQQGIFRHFQQTFLIGEVLNGVVDQMIQSHTHSFTVIRNMGIMHLIDILNQDFVLLIYLLDASIQIGSPMQESICHF